MTKSLGRDRFCANPARFAHGHFDADLGRVLQEVVITASRHEISHSKPVDAVPLLALPVVPLYFFDELAQGFRQQPIELKYVIWHDAPPDFQEMGAA